MTQEIEAVAPVDRMTLRRQRLDKGASRAASIAGIASAHPSDLGEMLAAIVAAAPDPSAAFREMLQRTTHPSLTPAARAALAQLGDPMP